MIVATLVPLQATILALVALGAPLVVLARDPVKMVVVNGIYNWALVVLFVVFGAPDVALSMLVVGAVGYPLVLLVWAVVDLPSFGDYRGPYGGLLNHVVPPERHVTEVVTATVFDYRGFDTLGEEFILFTAVTGVVLLLRQKEREEQPELDDEVGSDAVRVFGALAVGVCVLVGLWLIAFGYVTPGGGFQGGTAVASGIVLLWLVASYRAWEPVGDETKLDPFEGLGAGGYVVVGLAALGSGLPFLTNLFSPGRYGTLQSGGSIPFVNWASGIEVAAALLILFSQFLEEYIVPLGSGGSE